MSKVSKRPTRGHIMYKLAKCAEGTGLAVIAFDYVRNFPELMSRKVLLIGILIFVFGWMIERFLLKAP